MDYERLVARHKDAVYRQMLRVCGNREDAEDALIEALLAAYRSRDQLRGDDSFQAWLATIGRRVCGRIKRNEALLPILRLEDGELESVPDGRGESDEAARAVLKAQFQTAIDSLPEVYRTVYVQRELEGRPAEEVAHRTGLSVAAVKSRLHRARTMVRNSFDDAVAFAKST